LRFHHGFVKSVWVEVGVRVEGEKVSDLNFVEMSVLEEPRVQIEWIPGRMDPDKDVDGLVGGVGFEPAA
jgi:hypothetical protein